MSYAIGLLIPGKAQAKQRPKFNRYSGRAYTPEQTVSYENWVRDCYMKGLFTDKEKEVDNKPTDKPIKVDIRMYVEIPQSKSKKQKEKMLNGEIEPCVKPDVDNVAKSILDALNGFAYKDDKQIIELNIKKEYAETSWTEVRIKELNYENTKENNCK